MATGVRLDALVDQVRLEIGSSSSATHGLNARANVVQVLQRVQRTLHQEHTWPHLRVVRSVTLVDGTRYYNFPADTDANTVTNVHVKDGSEWLELRYGIELSDYSIEDSEAGAKSWPPLKWRDTGESTPQIEVWPIPDQAGSLRLEAQRPLAAFSADSDTCTLDGDILVLMAAGELLGRNKQEDAALKIDQAKKLIQTILGRAGGARRQPFILGGGGAYSRGRRLRPGIDYIR